MRLLKQPVAGLTIEACGRGFVGIMNDRLTHRQHQLAAQKALATARRQSRRCDVLIMDEVNGAMHSRLVSQREVLRFISAKPKSLTLVLTGRQAPPAIIRRADLVTEMVEIKHPFQKGRTAEAGIDY
jgi:cob(I)alamin adenosyltransferase